MSNLKSFQVQVISVILAESLDDAKAKFDNGDFGKIEDALLVDDDGRLYDLNPMSEDDVAVCDHCDKPMIPNVSTEDEDGMGWSCTTLECGDFTGDEIDADDLMRVGVPEWVAERMMALAEAVAELQSRLEIYE